MFLKSKLQALALYIFIFSINFETIKIFGVDFFITKVTFLFMFLICVITDFKLFLIKSSLKYISPLIIYFILLTIVSHHNINLISDDYFPLEFFLNIITLFILVNLSIKIPDLHKNGLLVLAYSTSILSVLCLLNIGTNIYSGTIESNAGRLTMFYMNSNSCAIISSTSIIIFMNYIFNNKPVSKIRKLFVLILILLILNMLILTGSRTGLISLFFGFILFIFLNNYFSRKQTLLSLLFSFSVIVPLLFFTLKDSLLFLRFLDLDVASQFNSERGFIWLKVFMIISENLIWGVGKTGYAYEILYSFDDLISPHNVIVEVLAYTGLIGLTFFMIFLIRLYNGFSVFKNRDLLSSFLLFNLTLILFSSQIFDPKLPWLFISYVISHQILNKNKTLI